MLEQNAPHYVGHRQRIKDKYLRGGLDGWLDHEVLEFLLSYSVPRRDTKPLAKRLLARFATLAGVFDAPVDHLTAVQGVTLHSALLLKLSRDLSKRYLHSGIYGKDLISSPQAAIQYLRTLLKASFNEEFHALFLDAANHCIASELIQKGTVNRSSVYPRTLAERALAHHAVGVILVHNHPGGTLTPSDEDVRATAAIGKALTTVDITLLDHFIITGEGYFSFKEHSLL